VVEPNLIGFPAKQDCGSEFVFLKVERAENAGVIEAFQDLVFLERASSDGGARGAVTACDCVQPDAADGLRGGMFGVKVLVGEERC
jgi:hypothetical protein